MSYFVIEHPKRGVFTSVELTPRFTWKRADTDGKHFASKAEAEAVIKTFGDDDSRRRCIVVEKT